MLFGHKDDFAIEAMVEPDLIPPSAVSGRMRIWCEGTPLGDYSKEHCGLPSGHLEELPRDLPTLWHKDFEDMSDANIFRYLDALLYGYRDGVEIVDDRSLLQSTQDAHRFGPFIFLTNWEEMFDQEGKAFILFPDGQMVRVIVQSSDQLTYRSLSTSVVAVKVACKSFSSWFKEESVRLCANDRAPTHT
jgi:hypothetical protein